MKIIEKTVEVTRETVLLALRKGNYKLRHVVDKSDRHSFNDPIWYFLEIISSFLFTFYMIMPTVLGNLNTRLPFFYQVYNILSLHALWLSFGVVVVIVVFQKLGIHGSPIGTTYAVRRGEVNLWQAWIAFGWQLVGALLAFVTIHYLGEVAGTIDTSTTFGAPTPIIWTFGLRTNGSIDMTGSAWYYTLQFFMSVMFIYSVFIINKLVFKNFKQPLTILTIRILFMWLIISIGLKFGVHLSTPIRTLGSGVYSIIWGGRFDINSTFILTSSVCFAYIMILFTGKDSKQNWRRYLDEDWKPTRTDWIKA